MTDELKTKRIDNLEETLSGALAQLQLVTKEVVALRQTLTGMTGGVLADLQPKEGPDGTFPRLVIDVPKRPWHVLLSENENITMKKPSSILTASAMPKNGIVKP